MGKITLMVEGSTVGTVAEGRGVVIEKEVSEMDSGRLVMAYMNTYGSLFKDENGNDVPPTIRDILAKWFDDVIVAATDHVLAFERQEAAKAAADAVKPIEVINASNP